MLLDVREDDEWSAVTPRTPSTSRWVRCRPGSTRSIRTATLYVICKAGGRSAKVAQFLARNGYEPINVNGGMLAWAEAGRPVVTDDGGPGSI